MKERGIIFNTEMVKATDKGLKTATRRPFSKTDIKRFIAAAQLGEVSNFMENGLQKNDLSYIRDLCPHGQIGDRLYVRETFSILANCFTGTPRERFDSYSILYKSDGGKKNFDFSTTDLNCISFNDPRRKKLLKMYDRQIGEWKPSIHMPKWAARIWLEITDIRVERVQDITREQCFREGLLANVCDNYESNIKTRFSDTWDSIYNNWSENPWVWVIEFTPLGGNQNE